MNIYDNCTLNQSHFGELNGMICAAAKMDAGDVDPVPELKFESTDKINWYKNVRHGYSEHIKNNPESGDYLVRVTSLEDNTITDFVKLLLMLAMDWPNDCKTHSQRMRFELDPEQYHRVQLIIVATAPSVEIKDDAFTLEQWHGYILLLRKQK